MDDESQRRRGELVSSLINGRRGRREGEKKGERV
jgi:hypothetical protein